MAQAVPRASGAGTVTVYLWGEDAAPSREVISAVKEVLDRQREVGVTVKVQAAQKIPLSLTIKVKVSDKVNFDWAKEQVARAVREFFDSLEVGEGLLVMDVTKAILSAAPVEKLELPAGLVDTAGRNGAIVRAGTITVEELP